MLRSPAGGAPLRRGDLRRREELRGPTNALVGCVAGASLRADYLRMIREARLEDVEVLRDASLGEVALDFIPEEMRRRAEAGGVDVVNVAGGVRSLTIRARKP